jgi:hypothetical protein
MKQLFHRGLNKMKYLFDFHRPQLLHLDCIDLVVENKLLLLFSWEAAHSRKLCIRPGKIKYKKSTGAAIVTLPAGTKRVDIIICSFWRSNKITILLNHVTLDIQSLAVLENAIWVLHRVNIHNIEPILSSQACHVTKLQASIKPLKVQPAINFTINQFQLNDYAQ